MATPKKEQDLGDMGLECAGQWALLKRWLIALFGKECDAARARAGSKGATQYHSDEPIHPGLRPRAYDTYLQQPLADQPTHVLQ